MVIKIVIPIPTNILQTPLKIVSIGQLYTAGKQGYRIHTQFALPRNRMYSEVFVEDGDQMLHIACCCHVTRH